MDIKKSSISGIYMIYAEISNKKLLKIGSSKNVFGRVLKYKCYLPDYEVIGFALSNQYIVEEKKFMEKFKQYKYKGEWFYYDQCIVDYFKSLSNYES